MVARIIVACALCVFALAGRETAAQVSPAAGRGLAGAVVDQQTGAAISGAHVRLIALPGDLRATEVVRAAVVAQEAVTDADGRFRFDAVPPGRYRLAIALDGFQPFDDPREIVIDPGADPPPALIGYTLRITADVQANVEAPAPADTAVGSAMNTLPGGAIVAAPGALEDVMRAFQARPGVAASQDDRNDLLVRGGGAIENATRIDGFDIPNPSHFGTPGSSGGALSIIAPWLIDRAVLRAGGFSVEFGERASSVLDLTLKPGAPDRTRGQAGASVGGAMAEVDGTLAGGRGSYLVSARRSFLEVAFARGNDRAVPHYGDFVGRFEYALSPAHRVEILGIASMDDVTVTSPGSDVIHDDQSVTMFGLSLRSQWSARTTTAIVASYARTRVDAEVGGADSVDGSDHSTEIELRVRGELRRRIGRDGELMAGVAVKRPDLAFGLDAPGFHNLFGLWVNPLHAHFPYAFTDVGGYGEVRLPSSGRLQLTAGIRVDRMGTTNRVYASPRVGGEFRLSDAVRLTGAYGMFRQTLPYVWIGSDVRNASLDPVRSRQGLAGISVHLPGRAHLLVEGFDKRYLGYPVDASAEWWHVLVDAAADYESPFVGRLAGNGRLFGHGIDSSITRRFADRFDLDASYSYWRVAQLSEYAAPRGLPLSLRAPGGWLRADYDIRHQVRLGLGYTAAYGWRVASQFRYASGRPYTPYSNVHSSGYLTIPAFNTARYPSYHRLDVRVDRTFTVRRTRLMIYAEVDNLYNRDNLYIYQWNWAARAVRPIYQWGRQPVAGFRWEF
jgi:hypothetical protein